MKKVRIALAAVVAIACFAFTPNKAKLVGCDDTLRWFSVSGLQDNQPAAITNLIPVATTFGDTNPNEVPSGTRAQILLSTFTTCAISEEFYCALGYAASQLEVREIPTGSGNYKWVPKNGETPQCVIFKAQ